MTIILGIDPGTSLIGYGIVDIDGKYKRVQTDIAIKYFNKGAEGINLALSLATGEYVAMLDSDDLLTEDALSAIVAQLNLDREINIIYTFSENIIKHTTP